MKKILKKVVSVTLALAMTTTTVFAKDIVINGFTQYKDVDYSNDVLLMKHDTLLDAMGVYYTFDTSKQRLVILHNDTEIVINRGSDIALVNGTEMNMGVKPKILENQTYNESIYVPVTFVASQLDAIKLNNDEKIQIKTEILNTVEPNLHGVTEETVVYSYEEALKKAIKNSNSIKTTQNQTESNKYKQETQIEQGISGYELGSLFGQSLDNTYVGLLSTEKMLNGIIGLEDENIEFIEDIVQLQLLSAIIEIEKTKDSINGLEEQSKILEQTYKNSVIMNELGMISDFDLKTLEKSVSDLKSGLQNLELNLQNNKYAINNILGVSSDEDNYIDFNMEIEPLDLQIDTYARHESNNSYLITMQKLEQEKLQFDYDNYLAHGQEYYFEGKDEALRLLQNKNMEIRDAIDAHELKIKEMYINAEMVAKNHEVLLADYEKSIEDYNKAVLEFDLGNITTLDVDKANANVQEKFNAVRANVMDYENLKYMILNPDLLNM